MRVVGVALVAALLVAGCAGESGGNASGAAPPTDIEVNDSVGGIEGSVVDDQIQPIAGASVGIKGADSFATTDEAGHFVLGGLAPGEYVLYAQRLGYDSAARPVTVVAGEVASTRFVLNPLSTDVAYPLTQTFTGLIECAWGLTAAGSANCLPLQFVFQQIGNNPTSTKIIGLFAITDPQKVEQGVFEMAWNPAAATTGGQLLLTVELEGTGVVTGETYERGQGGSPVRVVTDDAPFKDLKPAEKKEKVQTRTFPATTTPPTFVVNQKFTVFATACYLGDCPEDFTALSDA